MPAEDKFLDFNYHSQDQYDVFHHPAKTVVVRAGRRWGKTTGGATRVCERGFSEPGLQILWVDVTQLNISRYVNEIFLPMLPNDAYKWSEQRKILKFYNGSQVVFASAERPQNMEGFAYGFVVLNEAGIILAQKPRMLDQSIKPMTIEGKGADLLYIGNPLAQTVGIDKNPLRAFFRTRIVVNVPDDGREFHCVRL